MMRKLLLSASALAAAALAQSAAAKCVIHRLDLPVTMSGMRPLVPAQINGVEVKFLADSGAFFSVMDSAAVKRLKLPKTPLDGMRITGVGGSEFADLTRVKKLSLAGLGVPDVPFLVAATPTGDGSVGLLGQNVLGLGDVEYDLGNGMIHIYYPVGCGDIAADFVQDYDGLIKIDPPSEENPHTEGVIKVNGRDVQVMFDTGASRSVITRRGASRLGVKVTDASVKAAGLSGGIGSRAIEVWTAPFQVIDLGGEQIKNTTMQVTDGALGEADMLIGADFFLSHKVYVDNHDHRLFFRYMGGPVFALEGVRRPSAAPAIAAQDAAPADADAASNDPDALRRRAAALVSRRDFAAALATLDRAVALQPKNADLYVQRAAARLGNRQPVAAMADLDEAVRLKPDNARALMMRGALSLATRDLTRARSDFDAAVRASPDENLRLEIGGAYQQAGLHREAIAEYDAWIAAHPRNEHLAMALNARCWARATWGQQLDQALADCDAAVRRSPNSADLDSRGMVNLRLGRLDQAIEDYDGALKLQPKLAWSLYGRGLAKTRKGDKAGGAADIAQAITLNPALPAQAERYGLVGGGAPGAGGAKG